MMMIKKMRASHNKDKDNNQGGRFNFKYYNKNNNTNNNNDNNSANTQQPTLWLDAFQAERGGDFDTSN